MKTIIDEIIDIIDSEEEFSGNMPDYLMDKVHAALDQPNPQRFIFFVESMRSSAKMTKKKIKEKIKNSLVDIRESYHYIFEYVEPKSYIFEIRQEYGFPVVDRTIGNWRLAKQFDKESAEKMFEYLTMRGKWVRMRRVRNTHELILED